MIHSPRAWALEQSDRRIVFASGPETTMFAESRPNHVAAHRLPAWKAVLAIGAGHVQLHRAGRPVVAAPGLLVPPQLPHSCAATAPYVALFIDAWQLPPYRKPIRLGAEEARRLVAALGTADAHGPDADADLTAAYTELRVLAGPSPVLDPRVARAIHLCTRVAPDTPIAAIGKEVGLSPPRLRALIQRDVGIPLARLRRWSRLRTAVADLPDATVAAAAATAGFADQAHLTRTARDFLGRTPASLRHAAAEVVDRSKGTSTGA
ncbi:helix-turn-helix domain-containing protein [Streptomyces venezuelae]|uniref:helix-turn-helix domain-containing protein n=1 Tax=Streptomyces venezuelae TaxID=54571 RepID=UPI0034436609